jgi:rod shape-determining protein MreC
MRISPAKNTVEKENEGLRKINTELLKQVETLKSGLAAAESLEKIQAFLQSSKLQGLTAAIIGYSDDPAIKTFTISLGAKDNIQPGMAVVSDSGTMVGKVIATSNNSAVVREIRDSQSTVLARVENDNKSQGVVKGQRGIALRMTFIPKDDPITTGQIISTSGTESKIPPGIPMGAISSLATRPGDVFQTAEIFNPIRVATLNAVAVIRVP